MTKARKETVVDSESCYHCVSRCVRRAYLCGQDSYNGRNYDHRKDWIHERLKLLVKIFAIEVLACGLMDNHQHTLLRTRPDQLAKLSDKEIHTRWFQLFPKGGIKEPSEEDVIKATADTQRTSTLRKRLASVSWFMKSLNEYIARKANREDGCKGRFWEGRFRCQRVEGEAALLCCSIYIDLNPVRAQKAATPEESEFTSVFERIQALKADTSGLLEQNLWLTPIHGNDIRRGFLSLSVQEYLTLVDATGREEKHGKRGKIPEHLAPILDRIGVRPAAWPSSTISVGNTFSSVIGNPDAILRAASLQGKRWLKGLSASRRAFGDNRGPSRNRFI